VTRTLGAILTADVIGLLDRNVTVALAEISKGGCLLESSMAIAPGTVATLNVTIDGETYSDFVRVARCSSVPGAGSRHHVGVEFLPLERPAEGSLRLYAATVGGEVLKFSRALRLRTT
jgi:hypothetical protein